MNKEEIKERTEKLEYKDLLAEDIKEKEKKTLKNKKTIFYETAFSDDFNFAIRRKVENEKEGTILAFLPTEGQINYIDEKKNKIIPCTQSLVNKFFNGYTIATYNINEDQYYLGTK